MKNAHMYKIATGSSVMAMGWMKIMPLALSSLWMASLGANEPSPALSAASPPSTAQTLKGGLKLHELRKDQNTKDLTVYETYLEAQALEKEIVQMYKEIRASELSLIQKQTLARSMESTLTPLSERAKVAGNVLTENAKDAKDVKVFQSELEVVMRESDAIVSNANDLLMSLFPEQKQEESKVENQQEMTAEEIAEMIVQENEDVQSPQEQMQQQEMTQEQKEAIEKAKEQVAEMQKKIETQVQEVELNLEKALEELKETKDALSKEQEITEVEIKEEKEELNKVEEKEAIELVEKKIKEMEKEKKELTELKEKVEKASVTVVAAVEAVKEDSEDQEKKVEAAEKAIEEIKTALAEVKKVDEDLAESLKEDEKVEKQNKEEKISLDKKEAKEHSAEAVKELKTAEQAMAQAVQDMKEMAALMATLQALEGSSEGKESNEIAQKIAMEKFSHAAAGSWLDMTDIMKGNTNSQPVSVPVEKRVALWEKEENKNFPSIQKVLGDAAGKGSWAFVGNWYVLSRYDNAHRANRQKVYTPESIVDLNGRYLSEDGQPMKWEYESFEPPVIKPYAWEPWKIYYFATEMYFEEASDHWLAIGSDDRSDLWINGLPVWHSANHHKSWNPTEGFRKVHFKKGRNKILVRLENGHSGLGFSLYLHMGTPMKVNSH